MILDTYSDVSELHCSPGAHNYAEKHSTCFSYGELKILANEFNKHRLPQDQIKGKTKKEIVEKLLVAYKDICDKHQFCWIKQTLTDTQKITNLEKAFRPEMPEAWVDNINTWLNTYDILNVMNQYDKLYKDYAFLGCVPIDFSQIDNYGRCIGDMLCTLDIKNLIKDGKKRFGIVFNTDPSTANGQHWISLYCDLRKTLNKKKLKNKNYGIFFYDSVANPSPREVKDFKIKIVKQVNDSEFANRDNKIQRQFSNYDCGIFSIAFQTQMLKNIPFDVVCDKMKTDKYINSLRKVLYTPKRF